MCLRNIIILRLPLPIWGVAYVTEPEKEVFGHYERVSVKDTYDRIRKDLEEGLPLISNKAYGDTPKYHFTREAAQAFARRFYLYVGEWQKAIEVADEALGDNPDVAQLERVYPDVYSQPGEKLYFGAGECELAVGIHRISVCRGSVVLSLRVFYGRQQFPQFQRNDNVVNGVWAYRAEAYNVSSEALTMMKWKPYLKSDGVNSNSGVYYVMEPLFTTDEVVCDRIEALAMADVTMRLGTSNCFGTNKIKNYDSIAQPVTPRWWRLITRSLPRCILIMRTR